MVSPLWTPTAERVEKSNFTSYLQFLDKEKNLKFRSYAELHHWSVIETAPFWESLWQFFKIEASTPYRQVIGEKRPLKGVPRPEWFPGARLNFAQNLLRYRDDQIALIAIKESGERKTITYKELYQKVARCASALKKAGVKTGDRVAGYVPNCAESIVAMLAATSLGAIWSSCSPDFGVQGVLDRFQQIGPKVLFTVDGYTYNGKRHDLMARLETIIPKLSSLQKTIVIPFVGEKIPLHPPLTKGGTGGFVSWNEFIDNKAVEIDFTPLPFDHPVYILYSSGTTGKPKCLVHGAGGTLLQHLKELALHTDLKREDTIFFFTTCGWMMWNWLVSSMAVGATIVCYDGSPSFPNLDALWQMADQEKITIFGTSPKFLTACQQAGITPGKSKGVRLRRTPLQKLKTLLSTGSPLSVENFEWVYQNIKKDLLLASISGGTDIISCFMLGNPCLPVYAGEIQCPGLGMKVEAWDENGKGVIGQKGELVCTAPFPSMPVFFWNDPDGKKYQGAYFEKFPGVWHHGDFIEVTPQKGIIVYGRSDATLNPGGVRIGTAEIYRQVETIPEVADSLVIGQRWQNDVRIILFVVPVQGVQLDDPLKEKIRKTIRETTTPRHLPAKIIAVRGVPYTISGKKVELAVTRLIHGEPVTNTEALANPEILEGYRNCPELQS
ncbi:MAG: acetoacetate--CoA ligase [Deltaproteobacteria bacterium]|nr:acetoacetate--CoA ligase [Deltaproteobacteria bacterium]